MLYFLLALFWVASPVNGEAWTREARARFGEHCFDCHGGGKKKGGLNLQEMLESPAVEKTLPVFRKVLINLREGVMPPEDSDQPTEAERRELLAEVETWLGNVAQRFVADPGPAPVRRLNRRELERTLEDLFGIGLEIADQLPADNLAHGFDNNADVQVLSPLLLERWSGVVDEALERALDIPPPLRSLNLKKLGRELQVAEPTRGGAYRERGWMMYSNSSLWLEISIATPGQYHFTLDLVPQQAGGEPPLLRVSSGAVTLGQLSATAPSHQHETLHLQAALPAGEQRLEFSFVNDYYRPEAVEGERDRNLALMSVAIEGPFQLGPFSFSETHRQLLGSSLKPFDLEWTAGQRRAAAEVMLGRFARRALRRAPEPAEWKGIMKVYDNADAAGVGYEESLAWSLRAILLSPAFMYRLEKDPEKGPAVRELRGSELAVRLSYFLWSSLPDGRLSLLADLDQLTREDILRSEVGRMLKDPRASVLMEAFFGSWLEFENFREYEADPNIFPSFKESLKDSMLQEVRYFIETLLREDRPVGELIKAQWSVLNPELALHYGIDGLVEPAGASGFRMVDLSRQKKRVASGILTMPALLALNSHATRTSPVRRGRWVLEKILGREVPPAPPEVPALEEQAKGQALSVREQLKRHRERADCAICHDKLDPIGLGFENFDAIGRWRTEDNGERIPASGRWAGGRKYEHPGEFLQQIAGHEEEFVENMIQRMLTYALGRGLVPGDLAHVRKIRAYMAERGDRFSALIEGVALSVPFRNKWRYDRPQAQVVQQERKAKP